MRILNKTYFTMEEVNKVKTEVGIHVFSAQYQQNPISNENAIIKNIG